MFKVIWKDELGVKHHKELDNREAVWKFLDEEIPHIAVKDINIIRYNSFDGFWESIKFAQLAFHCN